MFFSRRNKKSHKSRPAAPARKFVRRLPLSLEVLESRILLNTDTWMVGSGNWDVGSNWSLGQAPGTGDTAIINTSSAATITIQSGDNISVQNVTTGSNDTLSITGGSLTVTSGTSTLSGALSMTGGSLTASGSGVSLTADGSTTVAGASLDASGGAVLSLPNLTSYSGSTYSYYSSTTFAAAGAGSKLSLAALSTVNLTTNGTTWDINATQGGQVDLSQLATVSVTGTDAVGAQFTADGTGSQIDISSLTSLSGSKVSSLKVSNSGTILDGELTTLNDVAVTLDGTGSIATSQWESVTNFSSIAVTGGSYSLSGITDFDGSSLTVSGGAVLSLPNLTSYSGSTYSYYSSTTFAAAGTGSKLSLGALSTVNLPTDGTIWYVNATQGGQVDFSQLATVSVTGTNSDSAQFTADGAGSQIDMSSLTSLSSPNNDSILKVTNSGTILVDKLTTLYASIQLSGASLNLPVLTSGNITLTNGTSVTIQGTVVSMPAAGTTGATLTVPQSLGLTVTFDNTGTLTDTTFVVGQGSNLALPSGTYNGNTSFNVAQGAAVDLVDGASGAVTVSGVLTGSGSGSVLLTGGVGGASDGLFIGTGGATFNFPGSMFQWNGQVIRLTPGDLTNRGTITLVGSGDGVLSDDGTLYNYGTIIQTGSGNLNLHSDNVSPTTFINEAGASYLIESDSGIDNSFGGRMAVQNAGTIKKTAGTGTSQLYVNGPLSNTGTIEADSGTLFLNANSITQLANNTLSAGTWNARSGATLKFPNGTSIATNQANVTIDGSGASIAALTGLNSNSGSLSLSNGANLTTSGDLSNSGSLTVGSGSTLSVGGNFTQTSTGTLNDAIDNTKGGGQVAVKGTATLAGSFNVGLPTGFTPTRSAVYPVMTYASASGTFSTVTGLGSSLTEQLNPTGLDLVNGAGTPVALQLSQVTAPTAATTGQQITVNWKVSNSSSSAANGSWQDSVYLSTTPTITGSSVLLGSVTQSGGLAAGGSYNASLPAAVPALPPGNYYVLVQADSLDQVPVLNRASDILAASTGQLAVSVPALTLGTPANGTFTAADQDQYYQVTVPAGGALQLALTSAASSGALALYVSQGTQPTPYSYQEAANIANQPNQSLNVPVTVAGTNYILVHSVSGAAAAAGYTLTVTQTNGLSVSAFTPNSGGGGYTSGPDNVTIEIDGTNFTPQTTVSLTQGADTFNDTAVYFESATKIFATFNLQSVTNLGNYILAVQNGSQSATASTPFQVTSPTFSSPPVAPQPDVVGSRTDAIPEQSGLMPIPLGLQISVPQFVRVGRTGTITVSYTNLNNFDMAAPLLEISSSNSNVFFSTPDDPNNFVQSAQVLGVASSGPAGILRPGQSGQLTLTVLTDGSAGQQLPISVQVASPTAQEQDVDWTSQKATLQPSTFSNAAWNVVWNNLMSIVGPSSASYVSALDQAASYLGNLGDSTAEISDVNRLWSFLAAQANASFPPMTLASVVDASLPTPGNLSLSLGRTFGSTIAERNQTGIFGTGWAPSWQASLSVDSAGNVSINTGTALAYFVALPNGTYQAIDSEYGTLTQSGGVYTYTNTAGTQYVFLANGNLNYVQDTNGNRITTGYNASNQLASLTYSNPADSSEPPEQLTLTYNAQGFVSQLADGTGNTWTYSYDTAGHLLSVTAPGNRMTSYTYDTGSNPETGNALLTITHPDGLQANYTYDPKTGRLTGISQSGGANPVTYTYPGEAEVTSTDVAGDKSTTWYNDLGLAARSEDPLGGISSYLYDTNGNLVSSTNSAGNTFQYSYDTNGNLTQTVNPLGQTVQMTYGPLSKLASISDAGGNTTQYQYSTAGNLLSITYPDGTQKSFTYDPLGNLSESVLQNGDPISYQYNAQGLVSKETFADGSSQAYTYDVHGNRLTASTYDSIGTLTGTTTLTYNAANQLTSITYPNGQYLKFTYNAAGQRTQSVDQSGYGINYTYDTLGRLSKLTDGSGNLIVQYTYNNLGQLVKKANGNGTYTTYAYDADGNLTNEVNYADSSGKTVNSSFTYAYNALNEETSVTDAAGNVTKYGYDALGQLTQVTLPDSTSITYIYNAAGDRTEVLTNGTATNYSSNADNEITQVGSTTYTYDANGNLKTATNARGTTTYTYNDLNQLLSITNPDGSVQTFQYSPLGFMVGTSTTSGGTTSQTNYLVDPIGQGNVVAAYNGSGSLIAHYNYGLGLVSQTGPSGTGYYDFDASGNTVGITGPSGAYVNQYTYLPFGETTAVSTTLPNPFTFAGQTGVMQIDSTNLFYMRARFYTPAAGQFLSNDPAGLRGSGTNIRRYANNDPNSFSDPSGLRSSGGAVYGTSPGFGNFSGYQGTGPVPGGAVDDTSPGFGGGAGYSTGAGFGGGAGYSTGAGFGGGAGYSTGAGFGSFFGAGARFGSFLFRDILPFASGLPFANGFFTTIIKKIVESSDPNALIGPAGYGTQNFILPAAGSLPYTVDFENDGSAAAQDVTVTEQLDPNLDWSTFQLGSFGFGSVNVNVPGGLTQYQTTIPYENSDGTSLNVKVNLNFNVQTGLLTVTFTSLDPTTGQAPAGVFDGFLPPDNSSGIGEGFVQYTVQPKAGLASGTPISAQASIVFDTNAAIPTQTVTNTIDATPPTSSVNPLPATVNSPSFTVSWSGSQPNGPGIATYNVYVSDNGGAFTPWLANTTQTTATYTGQVGHTYSFYSVASDALGLTQPTPTAAQASTYVWVPPSPPPPPPPPPPTLQVPPLLALIDSILGGIETNNSDGTETITDSIFGIPLFVSTFNSAGALTSVTLFGINITFLFE